MLSQDLSVIAPEMLLAAAALAGLMWGAFGSTRRDPSGVILWATVAILVVTGLWVGFEPEGTRTAFGGSFVSDGFARFSKVLILFGSAATHVHDSCGSGDPIFVHGLERTESWPDKETGEKRTKDVVVVDNRFGEVGLSRKYVSARIERTTRPAQAG